MRALRAEGSPTDLPKAGEAYPERSTPVRLARTAEEARDA
jgi:hypothetical protein